MKTLDAHGVDYVLIGGMAAAALGAPNVTQDIDICYRRDAANLESLASALRELGARLRGADEDIRFPIHAESLARGDDFTFSTNAGPLDCLATPAGTEGYNDLQRNASEIDIDGLRVLVADITDLIRMKRAAGRPRDREALVVLEALREELYRLDELPPVGS